MHATTPVPDARRSDPDTYPEEAVSLIRIIREACPGPAGQKPTMQQVGDLLGVSDATLYGYSKPPKGGRARTKGTQVPYCLLFALRVMVAGLPATRAALWGAYGTE